MIKIKERSDIELKHRRYKMSQGECKTCDRERELKNKFYPPHDASWWCQSGGHNHCSCDECF